MYTDCHTVLVVDFCLTGFVNSPLKLKCVHSIPCEVAFHINVFSLFYFILLFFFFCLLFWWQLSQSLIQNQHTSIYGATGTVEPG